jgi:putative acetyltransferase
MFAMTYLENVVIRTATNADRERIIDLVSHVLAEFHLPFDLDSKDADLENIESQYNQAGGIFEVIEDKSGRLLGTYGLYPLTDTGCELRKMYFLPEIRGLGVGREVLERAVAHARRLGFQTLELETISVLKRAIHLYTRFGFVPTTMDHPNARVDQRFILELNAVHSGVER